VCHPPMMEFCEMKATMDTKTLVVGQDVHMVSGVYLGKGKVTQVLP
jgi:hypothetical protein